MINISRYHLPNLQQASSEDTTVLPYTTRPCLPHLLDRRKPRFTDLYIPTPFHRDMIHHTALTYQPEFRYDPTTTHDSTYSGKANSPRRIRHLSIILLCNSSYQAR